MNIYKPQFFLKRWVKRIGRKMLNLFKVSKEKEDFSRRNDSGSRGPKGSSGIEGR